jgi:hypothetical protein
VLQRSKDAPFPHIQTTQLDAIREHLVSMYVGGYVADVLHSVDQLGRTPVQLAAGRGHLAVLRLLVDAGATLDHADHEGATSLHAAAMHGHDRLLVRHVPARAVLFTPPLSIVHDHNVT